MTAIYQDDIGTVFTVDVGTDISDATVTTLKYTKPDGSTGEWAGALDGTTAITYTVIVDDLDLTGRWKIQAYVETPAWQGHSGIGTFEVKIPIEIIVP